MPRPPQLTAESRAKIVRVVRAGGTDELAASMVGVTERSLYRWLERGRAGGRGSGPYRRLVADVERAQAEREAILVARVSQAAERGSWRAAAWILERQWPEHWGLRAGGVGDDDGDVAPDALDVLDELAEQRSKRLK